MSRVGTSNSKKAEIAALLSSEPSTVHDYRALVSKKKVPAPAQLGWEPEFCIEVGGRLFLVHQLLQEELPAPIQSGNGLGSARTRTRTKRTLTTKFLPLIYCPSSSEISGVKRAERVVESCAKLCLTLIADTSDGAVLVLPPDFVAPSTCNSQTEHGHVPSWLLDSLLAVNAFSGKFCKILKRFQQAYNSTIRKGQADYETEAEVLIRFLQEIRRGDTRLFLPLDRFHALKSWERGNANTKSRDHFFHTINNLLLGYLVLGLVFNKNDRIDAPEKFINGGSKSRIMCWESLWFLTCINHDPAYSAEHFWPNYSYSIGISGAASDEPVPKEVIDRLVAAWDTHYKGARQDLTSLYNLLRGEWQLVSQENAFDRGLKEAYWNGTRSSHSVVSGFMLINSCLQDRAYKAQIYDRDKALKACWIAALSMLFHDQHCRQVLLKNGVSAIAFENLPYAAVLMFVDALQDDRRDISKMQFSKHEILTALTFDSSANEITARVCLAELPLKYWPGKISEYESATKWINSNSTTHFRIDYKTAVHLEHRARSGKARTKRRGSKAKQKAKRLRRTR